MAKKASVCNGEGTRGFTFASGARGESARGVSGSAGDESEYVVVFGSKKAQIEVDWGSCSYIFPIRAGPGGFTFFARGRSGNGEGNDASDIFIYVGIDGAFIVLLSRRRYGMIQFAGNANVFIMHEPINFRGGIDKTAAVVRVILQKEPMDGALFVFRSKMGHSLRILYYDGSGFWLCTKRLSSGTYNKAWPKDSGKVTDSPILVRELQILIWGADPASCRFPEAWRRAS